MSHHSSSKLFKTFNDCVREVLIEFLVTPGSSLMDVGRHNEELCSPLIKSGLSHYVFVEPLYTNQVARKEAWDRVTSMRSAASNAYMNTVPSVEMIAADPTTEQFSPDMKSRYECVGCFDGSALMRGFNEKTKCVQLIKNISEVLKPGGFFFGSVIDSAVVFSSIDRMSDKVVIRNENYTIEINSPYLKEFGTTVELSLGHSDVLVGSLVHFPSLIEICREHGLKMLDIQNFEEFSYDYRDAVTKRLASYEFQVHSDDFKKFRLFTTFVFQKL